MFTLLKTLVLLIYFQFASSLYTAEVSLNKDKEYLRLQERNPDFLQCFVTHDDSVDVEQVVWYHNDNAVMTWGKIGKPTVAKEVDPEILVLTRDDWQLQFTILNLNLSGNYRCEVTTSNLEVRPIKSLDYELLIVDMPYSDSELAKYYIQDCRIQFSWFAPPVNPKPDPLCGIWSVSHSYISTVPTFDAIPYYNGSVAYILNNETFQIHSMPADSLIRCELKVTKKDGTVIQLLEKKYKVEEVLERGCPQVEVGVGLSLEFKNDRTTCHNEIVAEDSSKFAYIIVTCKNGYRPKYPEYVTTVTLECHPNKWRVSEGQQWNHFDNLLCVLIESDEIDSKIEKKSNLLLNDEPSSGGISNEETSSGMQKLMSPWVVLSFVSLTIMSGIVWGLKGSSRKKDPRYMA